MNVLYKCGCFKVERTLCVPDRVPNSDLMAWMGLVQNCLAYDHGTRNPECMATKMEYLKIPVDKEAHGIGEAPEPE